jgi:CrcB protein
MIGSLLLIGLGGVLGANTRYLISNWAAERYGTTFPFGTFLINVSGSVLLGLVVGVLGNRSGDGQAAQLLLVTGFLGAYTTFSTFTFESLALLRLGRVRGALINALGSTALGVGGAAAGLLLAGRLTTMFA